MKKNILLVLSLIAFSGLHAQIITTIAGTGTASSSGDGGVATAATINTPGGLVIDSAGNIFVSEFSGHRIRKIPPSGIITTVAGIGSAGYSGDGGPASSAQLNSPVKMVIDLSGNIYFAEQYNNVIRKISTTGIISTFAGNGSAGYSGDGGPASSAKLNQPTGVAIDASGNLYIADWNNQRVRKVSISGIMTTFAGTGSAGSAGDGGPATAAQLYRPFGLCFDISSNLYIADAANHKIRKVTPGGIITTFAGTGAMAYTGDGGSATAASFYNPTGVVFDAFNNLYIAAQFNSVIRKVLTSGIISTIAGTGTAGFSGDGGPATAAQLNNSNEMLFDRFGNLVLCDNFNNRVRKIQYAPTYASDSFSIFVYKYCAGPQIRIAPNHYSAGMYVKTYFGDGTTDSSAILSSGSSPVINHSYGNSGTYSVKHVLCNSSTVLDTFLYSYTHTLCNSFPVNFYYDANSNCTKDISDDALSQAVMVEVDSNGVAIDTLSATSGLYYTAYGSVGDIYAFKILTTPVGFHTTCPSTGIIYDTIGISVYAAPARYMGMECVTSTNFDLSLHAVIHGTALNDQYGSIYVQNSYCMPTNATVTLHYSPKYDAAPRDMIPAPTSYSGNTIIWDLSSLSSTLSTPVHIQYGVWHGSSALYVGDTVHSSFIVVPTSGDADSTNNTEIVFDTVRAGYDPNEISVKPAGCIASGAASTQLQYTINFENTGNDTAHNIYVMDTLPLYVDATSMRIVMASHEMYTTKIKDAAGHNILKFDFPAINLLDSSHHGQCDGAVIFNIKTKPGLATGTDISNRAGIYFDVNPVVMTNKVTNGIGCPPSSVSSLQSAVTSPLVYPNPANDVLNIKVAENSYQSFTISNNIGSVILSGTLTKTNTQLNIQSLPAGLYFITLKGEQGTVAKKVVKW